MNFNKAPLWIGLGSLATTTFLAVSMFLFGTFSEIILKMMGTTLAIGWFGLMGSVPMRLVDSPEKASRGSILLTVTGIGASGIACLLTLGIIWSDTFRSTAYEKNTLILAILSFSAAYSSILVKYIQPASHPIPKTVMRFSVLCVMVVAFMLIELVIADWDIAAEFFYRFLAVASVLGVSGSIALPITKRIYS